MNPGEHDVMARVEDELWWYRGLRDVLARTLERPDLGLPPHPDVLDAGCGTGRNLALLRDRLAPRYLGGFDLSPEAIELARAKAPEADLRVGDVCSPPPPTTKLDLIVSLDVLYIPGVDRALPGLRKLVASLRSGGLLVLNLPAYDWLYSEHDVAIHTRERFTLGRVQAMLEALDLVVELASYRLCLLFPLVVAARLPGMLGLRRDGEAARSDLHAPVPAWLDRALYAVVALENRLIVRGVPFPFGSSVFAVARKR